MLLRSFLLIVGLGLSAFGVEPLSYNRDVRPILSDTCFKCHGPDKANLKADLHLDVRDKALASKAFVVGKPAESEMIKRIRTQDKDDVMPPEDAPRQLDEAQKKILERWIAEGAVYEPHWSYIPPVKTAIPTTSDATWSKHSIDAFIAQRLEAKHIKPSPSADPATLIRRASLDLTGLPPSPAAVTAFVADKSDAAYEKMIDALLASPHYGERMAVPWLDAVRFADTVGFHGDQNQNNFPYRDWVIDAFNRNMPFDRFTAEQLAGDLLPDANTSTRVASGFNRLNMMTREGGAQPKEYLAKYSADRVRTLGGAWLGSTLACCECHDHKYDPWAAKDFYRFASFFADVRQWGVYADYGYSKNPDLKGFNNDYPFPPEIEVDSVYLQQRAEKLRHDGQLIAQQAVSKLDPTIISAWRTELKKIIENNADGWQRIKPMVPTDEKADYTLEADGTPLITAKRDSDVTIPLMISSGWISSVRIELAQVKNGTALLEEKTKDNEKTKGKEKSKDKASVHIKLNHLANGSKKVVSVGYRIGDATNKAIQYLGGSAVLGLRNGWVLSPEIAKTAASAVFVLDHPIHLSEGDKLEIILSKNDLHSCHIAVSPLVPSNLITGTFTAQELKELTETAKTTDPAFAYAYMIGTANGATAYQRLIALEKEIEECRHGKAMTTVTEAWKPTTVRVLPRGNWQDESGEVVDPMAPGFLHQISNDTNRRLTRLDLASWLTAPDNPLTARVFVNRVWAQFMGVGLCATVDDLGLQGEWPSHPELLDWLAVDFREHGWDIKRLVKSIMMSNTYRQSSVQRSDIIAVDPANRLRAMQSPRRLDAEFIRDNALSISGLLVSDIGGPSIKPYQPPGYYANLQFPNRDYLPSANDQQYRRGLYMHWQRTFLHPMLANFDAPARDECIVFRSQANSPQQALTLLNDPTFVEAARSWAVRVIANANSDEKRLVQAFQSALGRAPTNEESGPLLVFLAKQRQHYTANIKDAEALLRTGLAPLPAEDQRVEVAAWTQMCRVLLNLHETITRL
jgi:Protein of unknown function (DUF1553)/Protein of unknown function (DUF1549)/Planctomycete cytochrome C